VPRLAPLLAALLVLASPPARAEGGLDLWFEAGGGADTNPRRLPGPEDGPRGFTSLLGRARLSLEGEAARGLVTLTEAARLYPSSGDATALASRLEAAGRWRLGEGVAATLSGAATDYRSGPAARPPGGASRGPELDRARWGVLAAGWSRCPGDRPAPFRSSGPEGWLRATLAPSSAHRLAGALGASLADYPAWSDLGPPAGPSRADRALLAGLDWSFRGEALLSAGWSFTLNRSDAAGGDFTRHRFTASAATRLPAELTLAARAALQWTRWPDPLLLPASVRLAEGQEALDTVEARLSRPLLGPVELSLSLAWYHADGTAEVPGYQRAVATLAVGWRGAAW
jgi:hypothetical protein